MTNVEPSSPCLGVLRTPPSSHHRLHRTHTHPSLLMIHDWQCLGDKKRVWDRNKEIWSWQFIRYVILGTHCISRNLSSLPLQRRSLIRWAIFFKSRIPSKQWFVKLQKISIGIFKTLNFFNSKFRFTAKLRGRHRAFSYPTQHPCYAHPLLAWYILDFF